MWTDTARARSLVTVSVPCGGCGTILERRACTLWRPAVCDACRADRDAARSQANRRKRKPQTGRKANSADGAAHQVRWYLVSDPSPWPLTPGLPLSVDELDKMLAGDCLDVGAVIRHANGRRYRIVRRPDGRLDKVIVGLRE